MSACDFLASETRLVNLRRNSGNDLAISGKCSRPLEAVNREDRYENWLDSLPFPLASILWVCHTQSGSLKEQYERKIQFFEALSEFLGIIFLSAFSANEAIWG